MKKGILAGLSLIVWLGGSIGAARPQKSQPYSGPRARVSVSSF